MKIYEVIEHDEGQTIKATEGDKELFIPTDPNNSDYSEYLAYTAWVNEGNDPDEFWNNEEL